MISSIAFGLFGLAVLMSVAYAFSNNKKSVDWKQVAAGIGLQVVFAIIVISRMAITTASSQPKSG